MNEILINLHMHTTYSDGTGTHEDIARAALKAGLDAVIVTDHNIWVNGIENYHIDGDQRVLLLTGEEVHDQARQPQKNHLLVIGAQEELAPKAWNLQRLIDAVRGAGGLSFIAHPIDPSAPAVGEDDISWVDWDVHGFTGIELWNGLSEFKSLLKSKLHAIYYALNFKRVARGPHPQAIKRWDQLLVDGQHIVAVGGSDAHALRAHMGVLRRTIYPYELHFKAINTHLLLPKALAGDLVTDRKLILDALAGGRAFIGYDLPAPTRGFRFYAQGMDCKATMGEEVSCRRGVTMSIRLPRAAECRLIKDGQIMKTWRKRQNCTYITSEVGVYRVEVYIHYLGRLRGWIFSNPIYVIP